MQTPPLVSVIIPTYNRANLVGKAVQSVLAQTYRHLELLVVDDASTDDTAQTIAAFDDPRIRYINHETNRGGAAARNTGIALAQGKYIAFLDSDDYWLPQKLSKQVRLLSSCSPQVGIVHTNYRAINGKGQPVGEAFARHRGNLYDTLLRKNCIGSSTVLARRTCFERVGSFDETLPSCQDWDMWIRIAAHYTFEVVPEVLVVYRAHSDALRITNNAAAVFAGYDRIAEKHLSPAAPGYARIRSEHLFRLGKHLCHSGAFSAGRKHFLRALALMPWNPKYMAYLFAATLGKTTFILLEQVKHSVLRLLQRPDPA